MGDAAMEYPLLLEGERRGSLTVERRGLYTYLEAAAKVGRGLYRIWVQGGGAEAYLGIMEPGDDGMVLRRKLSRRDMAAFPAVIEQASDRRLALLRPASCPPEDAAPEAEAVPPPDETAPAGEPDRREEPPEPGLLWTARRDGSLAAREGDHWLLALPAELRRRPPGADLRTICGREYLVFRY